MLEIVIGLVVGSILGIAAIHRGQLATEKGEPWYPVSSLEIRRKLKREGTLDAFLQGRIACSVCEEPVTFGNLWSIMEDEESQDFICRNPECFRDYLRVLHEEIAIA